MPLRTHFRYAPLVALLALASPLRAQQLTVDRIFSREFALQGVAIDWAPGGSDFEEVEYNAQAGATDLWTEGIRTGKRSRLVEGAGLVASDTARPIDIEEYQWSPDRSKLLIFTNAQRVWRLNTKGTYYVYDRATRRLTPLSRNPGWQMFAKFSPDGKKVGFVRDNDLFVVDVATGAETRLTRSGSDVIINGTTDWVYEEELDLRDAWRWSPDSKRIAFWQFDQSPIQPFYILDQLSLYPKTTAVRYPKAGTPNSHVRIGVLDLVGGQTTWMDVGSDSEAYLPRMDFAESPTELVIQRLNRHQDRLDVLLGDISTGRTRTLFTESVDSGWVDVDDDLTWIDGGKQFLWTSERDGFNHVYLYGRDGKLVRQVTRGDFEVSTINGVDEKRGWLYFTAASPTPMERQLFRIGLDGRGMQRITQEPGTHSVDMSPDASVYLDVYARNGVPPVFRLHAADGTLIRVLEDNARLRDALLRAGVARPETFRFTTSDGVSLNGWMIKPRNFDPTKKYPVLMYVYGGPGSQTVTDDWQGSYYLWHQLLAEQGYMVVSVDGRGTGGRGRAFKQLVYLRLGRWEVNDQVEAAKYLGTLPYVDRNRIGMWGWSYGGYLTALALTRGADVFKAGIAVAPVTHWGLYDTIYSERFLRTPQENPTGYRESSPLTYADRLQGSLLLIHGTGDDNVHFQNTVELVNQLEAAGKQFDVMFYPNRTHSISGGSTTLHLYATMTDWVLKHL